MAEHELIEGKSTANPLLNIIYTLFSLLIVLLIARFAFLLLGANPANGFVGFIYNLSDIFVAPFRGIFNGATPATGVVVRSVFDTATLVAIIIYAVLGWLIAMPFRATRQA